MDSMLREMMARDAGHSGRHPAPQQPQTNSACAARGPRGDSAEAMLTRRAPPSRSAPSASAPKRAIDDMLEEIKQRQERGLLVPDLVRESLCEWRREI